MNASPRIGLAVQVWIVGPQSQLEDIAQEDGL